MSYAEGAPLVDGLNAPDGKEISVTVISKLTLTSNDKYTAWTFMFTVLLICFGVSLIVAIFCFCRQKYLYHSYSKERRLIKRQLEIIKDTEYANFLLLESEKLKNRFSGVERETNPDMDVRNET